MAKKTTNKMATKATFKETAVKTTPSILPSVSTSLTDSLKAKVAQVASQIVTPAAPSVPSAPSYTPPPAYSSAYQDRIDAALDKVTNREAFSYDPLQDANYQALAKIYHKQGEQAAKNTLGDVAALNGGFGSSYAVTASQQARNDYNQQLASQVPGLQEAAYNKYLGDYNMDLSALNALRDADDTAYSRYRDTVSDSQWQYGADYEKYRDSVSDNQWNKEFNYQQNRDSVADSQWQQSYDRSVFESNRDYKYQKSRDKVTDSQWAKEYALQKAAAKDALLKSASSGSGSGGSSSDNYYGKSLSKSNSGAPDQVSFLVAQGLSAAKKATSSKKK